MLAVRGAPRRLLAGAAASRVPISAALRPQWHRQRPLPLPPLFICRQCRHETTTAAATAEAVPAFEAKAKKTKKTKTTRAKKTKAAEDNDDAEADVEKPKPKRTRKKKTAEDAESAESADTAEFDKPKRTRKKKASEEVDATEDPDVVEKPKRTRTRKAKAVDTADNAATADVEKPKRARTRKAKVVDDVDTADTADTAPAEKPKTKTKRTGRPKAVVLEAPVAAEAAEAAEVAEASEAVEAVEAKEADDAAEKEDAADEVVVPAARRGRKTKKEEEADAIKKAAKLAAIKAEDPDADLSTRTARFATSNVLSHIAGKGMLHRSSQLAEDLFSTGIWTYGRWARLESAEKAAKAEGGEDGKEVVKSAKKPKVKGDKFRVNIVSESLVDDSLTYLKDSLLPRHKGCDILDIYPGAGLWSRKLNDLLEPRSHILLEPDEDLYRPFLQPLLDRPNVSLVPKSGIIWRELSNILTPQHLPHQVERPINETPQRNDTLLVTANLAFFPRRKFGQFDSLSQLIVYQFINSIRASSLFNKYGLIRMLIWVESGDRNGLLARSIQRRRRLAVDGEMSTEWITEIAGPDDFSPWFIRDSKLDMASIHRTLGRMDAAGIQIPRGRESMNVHAATKSNRRGPKLRKAPPERLDQPPEFSRPYREELSELEDQFKVGAFAVKSTKHRRMLQLQWRTNREDRVSETINDFLQRREAFADEYDIHATRTANIRRREQKWTAEIDAMSENDRQEYSLYKDNLHIFKQDPPVLHWDRRVVEPLVAKREEFFPNAPCALLDIQPKAVHPLLRPNRARVGTPYAAREKESSKTTTATTPTPSVSTTTKPDGNTSTSTPTDSPPTPTPSALSSASALSLDSKAASAALASWTPDYAHSSDFFDLIIRGMLNQGADPVRKAIEIVWPGAADGVLLNCPSLWDRRKGGHPVGGPYGEITARSLNEKQWIEILEAWMRWPFRPTLSQLAARISEEPELEDDEGMD